MRMPPSQVGSHHVDAEIDHLEGGEQAVPHGLRRRLPRAEIPIVVRTTVGQLGLGFTIGHTPILRGSARLSILYCFQRVGHPSRCWI